MPEGTVDNDFGDNVADITAQDRPGDWPNLHVGDHVVDRDDADETTMLVIGIPSERALEYTIGGDETVADYNPDYPAADHVIEVVYPQRTDAELSTEHTYAFPRARLERVAAVHDVGGEE